MQLNGDYLLPVGVIKYYSFSVVKVTQTFSSLGLLEFLSYCGSCTNEVIFYSLVSSSICEGKFRM